MFRSSRRPSARSSALRSGGGSLRTRSTLFTDATNDHQWIHLDAERAKEGPFGGTIAHGCLSLSSLPSFMFEMVEVGGIAMASTTA
ncbi:MaoC/PaaZ C-terminal domain-containing protein [Nonomuraea sp. NPDC049269]|uniref:MaoC/PaaZ C-terminal domain-containing protein n=1 Tax=Nonomuraea sp. NPDC049269 TaxID=3364349 RepID=UPI00371F7818